MCGHKDIRPQESGHGGQRETYSNKVRRHTEKLAKTKDTKGLRAHCLATIDTT